MQKPLLHSLLPPQLFPSVFLGTQLPFTDEVQKSPSMQSLSSVQLTLQLVPPQT